MTTFYIYLSLVNCHLSTDMRGLVIKNTGSWYTVRTEDGRDIESKIKGNFRLKDIRSTNPIAVGDRVVIDINQEGTAFISEIEDRKNYIIRRASNLSKQSHIIAANLDQAMLIVTVNYPITTTIFIDRFLATAEAYRVPVKLVFNKVDRYRGEDRECLEELIKLYTKIGYPCSKLCARTGEGLDELKAELKDKITLLSGHSGVGKSTIINTMVPGVNLRTGTISEYHNKGMHTTTFSEMIPLPDGGYIIDTPGIKGFGTIEMEGAEVSHYFPEIFSFSSECKFSNCSHRHEPGCAVLKAVENHRISESRYKSYLNILDDKEESKYREEY
ncbi:ribosome biogenesis GTPase [Parabacteroides chinchillae]|uniref:Small ribosomal subunit biogenesis GTPase RsgA n=2 Tax=Parabacteroides chinchillae TaxID=871327 RepID=A0A8G2BWR5_9BACT|nr:ribosome biogenesis GTPase [Parabacteroides chinchillae]